MPDEKGLFRTVADLGAYDRIYDDCIATWPLTPEPVFLETPFGRTHCLKIEQCDGPPLILLHGGQSSSVIWQDMVAGLAKSHRLYALDIPGDYGKSLPAGRFRGLSPLMGWLTEVMDALQLDRARFLGFSYGGWITLHFCRQHPERVNKAALIAPAASFLPLRPAFLLRAIWSMIRPTDKVLRSFYLWASEPACHQNPDYMERMLRLVTLVKAGRKSRGIFINPTVFKDDELQSISVPLVLLIGEHEVIYDPRKSLDRARRLIPGIETHLVPRASHDLVYANPGFAVEKIAAFLEKD